MRKPIVTDADLEETENVLRVILQHPACLPLESLAADELDRLGVEVDKAKARLRRIARQLDKTPVLRIVSK